jgi:hypothetical protein
MDNIKTKLQTQTTTSTCEKIETLIKDFDNPKKDTQTKSKLSTQSAFSTVQKPECLTEPQIKYNNIISTAKLIYKEDGFLKGFFRGMTPRIINNSPSCAISWGTYEIVKHLLSNS